MKKYLVFENQFKEFCENYRLDGFEHSYPEELPKEYPCVILVEEYNDLHGNYCVKYHYVYESDFNFYKEDVV